MIRNISRKPLNLAIVLSVGFMLLIHKPVQAQRRGDNLAFQGLSLQNRSGVKATAMGGAYTAVTGELDALFWNPAGLTGLSGFQISANYASSSTLWRESQDYRPNRQAVAMSFILDGLHMPNPEYSGWYDGEAFLADSTYIVDDPALGLDSYGEKAADWQTEMKQSGLGNIAAAYPFKLMKKEWVIGAGISQMVLPFDYDRNETYLDPHPAYDGYGDMPDRVTAADDSVRISWSNFERKRSEPLSSIHAALAVDLVENVTLGLGFENLSGETSDYQSSDLIGHFDLIEGYQIFRFRYDTLNVETKGTSSFQATQWNLGLAATFNKMTVGVSVKLPAILKREWQTTTTTSTPDSVSEVKRSGTDEMDLPLYLSGGLSFQPHPKFKLALDIEHRAYAKSEFALASGDTTHQDWVNQTQYRVGAEYKPFSFLSLLAGYRNVPQVFIPDGAAIKSKGPTAQSYSLGISIYVPYGRIDAAYEKQILKYYDVYFSNTNWNYRSMEFISVGYTLIF